MGISFPYTEDLLLECAFLEEIIQKRCFNIILINEEEFLGKISLVLLVDSK